MPADFEVLRGRRSTLGVNDPELLNEEILSIGCRTKCVPSIISDFSVDYQSI